MALSWQLVDARTGVIRGEAPRVVVDRPVAATQGRYESLSATLPYAKSTIEYANAKIGSRDAAVAALTDWKAATRPGANVLVAIDEDDNPLQGYLILTRTRDHTASARLDCFSAEAYLARRYAGTYTGTGIDQNQVFADLITNFIADGTLPGLPIRVVWTPSAQTQTVAFADEQDLTIDAISQQLSGIPGGIRWTIKWERQHNPERITPVLYVADRLGSAKIPALTSPNSMFSMPGNVQAFSVVEDYTSSSTGGANIVTMSGGGASAVRDQSTANAADYAGRPAFEFRSYPQTSTGSIQLTMAQHAAGALAILQDGSKVVSITARARGTNKRPVPKVGSDYGIGDDIGFDLMAPGVLDGELSNGVGQVIGWQRDDNVQLPVFAVADASAA